MSKRTAHNKLSEEEVLQEFKEKHGNAFDYSKVKYVDGNTPVEIYCKKHDFTFYPTPKSHKNGSKCKHCGREEQIKKARKEVEKFKEQIIEIYGDKYNLDLIDYKNTKTPVIIGCPIHGEKTRKPCDILQGIACDECDKKKTKSTDKELFILEAKKVYGDKDDYTDTNIVSSRENIKIRCTKHDLVFEKNIQTYLAGWGCPECSAENYSKLRSIPKDVYYERVKKIHNNKYEYCDDYTFTKYDVSFICKEHGKVKRNGYKHLLGYGCPYCADVPKYINRMSKEGYCRLANNRPTFLYLIECYDGEEKFLKIGKTFQKIKSRFTKNSIPYKVNVIKLYTSTSDEIWDLEIEMHEKYKEYSYKPKKYFNGYTECYNLSLPIDDIWKTS